MLVNDNVVIFSKKSDVFKKVNKDIFFYGLQDIALNDPNPIEVIHRESDTLEIWSISFRDYRKLSSDCLNISNDFKEGFSSCIIGYKKNNEYFLRDFIVEISYIRAGPIELDENIVFENYYSGFE